MRSTDFWTSSKKWLKSCIDWAIPFLMTTRGRRNEAFCHGEAGKTINLVTADDVQEVIDRAHIKVYNESRLSRIETKALGDTSEAPDWDSFDTPTYERKAKPDS